MQLVKNNLQAVTLAIGDGANDVSMIKGMLETVEWGIEKTVVAQRLSWT